MCRAASQVAQWERSHLPVQETWVCSLGWEAPLEKTMATHSNILAWGVSWAEKPGVHGVAESDMT